MTDITDTNWSAMSDKAIINVLGSFIKQKRLEQNKTQAQLSKAAGISRDTLSLLENGVSGNLATFIQLLRALDMLHLLKSFQIQQQISPLQLARIEKQKRLRASRTGNAESTPQTSW